MAEFGTWIPVKWRLMTEEEKKDLEDYYFLDETEYISDFPLPDVGDEILISKNNGKWIDLVEFSHDEYGVGDDCGNDWFDEVDAWMPLPKGYKKEEEK